MHKPTRCNPCNAWNVLCYCLIGWWLMAVSAEGIGQTPQLTVATQASRSTAFVNEQILLKRQVQAAGAAFNITGAAGQVGDADVVQLSEQSESRDSLQHTDTYWAIFARDSGELTIGEHHFQATLPASGGANPLTRASSPALSVQILPPPNTPPGAVWLPAADVQIKQRWAQPGPLVTGEPKELVITVSAVGQRAAAIPPLATPTVNGLRLYPSPASLRDQLNRNGVTGTRTERYSVVAATAGPTAMPNFSLSWFNTGSRAWDRAQSNALILSIKSSGSSESPSTQRWLVGLTVLIAVIAIGLIIRHRANAATEPQSWRRLKRDLRNGDAAQVRQSLLNWSKTRWPSARPMQLEQLAALLDDPHKREQLLDLNIAAYRESSDPRDGLNKAQLESVFKTLRNLGMGKSVNKPELASLYRVDPGR